MSDALHESKQRVVDFVSRYSMLTNSIVRIKDIGGADGVQKSIRALKDKGILADDLLFVNGKIKFWALTKAAKKSGYIPPDLDPFIPGTGPKGDKYNIRNRYAIMMFCCGGPKQRTLLSRKEVKTLLGYEGQLRDGSMFYIDKYFQHITGQALLGHIMVDGGESTEQKIAENIRNRAAALYDSDSPILRKLIEERLFILSYLCQSPGKATRIELALVKNKDAYPESGIWFNVCNIDKLQTTRQDGKRL